MKFKLLPAVAFILLLGQFVTAQNVTSPLKWKVAPEDDVSAAPALLSAPGFNTKSWVNAVVPGTVFYSYVHAGKEKNPDYAENIYKVDKAKYNRPFWYRTEFSSAGVTAGRQVWINFNGINKRGEVYLNCKYLGVVNGLSHRVKFNVTTLLNKTKTNALAVLVFTPNLGHGLANREAPTYLSSGSWDWMPAVPGLNSGITDEVTITTTGPVSVNDPWISSQLPDRKLAELTVKAELENSISAAVTGNVNITINPGNINLTGPQITVAANSKQLISYDKSTFPQLTIKNPQLWWPNGYGGKADGTQNLYSCTVNFRIAGKQVSDKITKKFGIRKITSDTTALNGPMRVYVNDVPVLLKGGNWGMSDYMLKVRSADYDTRIRLHQEMNFNTIRNWTGEVTDDAFYDYCDKYGIMVWDDFWLNNFGPIDSMDVFRINAISKVKKLRDHPSIIIWCGANEGVPGGDPKGALSMVIKNAIHDNDGEDRIYLDRSNAGKTNPNFSIHGGSRQLSGSGLWANADPKTYFTDPHNGYLFSKDSYGMRSELGTATFVNIESFKKFMPKDYWVAPTPDAVNNKTNMWARHYFSTDGDLGGGSSPVKYINDVNSRYGKAASLEEFCKKAQLLNVETTKAMYEAWNDHLWKDATGMLMWMSQSAYPTMIWQTYDYYFDLTGAYFGAKTACEPVHIQWNSATNSVKVINNKPYALTGLTANAEVYNMDGKRLAGYSQTKKLDAASTSATEAFVALTGSDDQDKLTEVHFLKLKLTDAQGKVLSDNFYWIGKTYLEYQALNNMPSVTTYLKATQPVITTAKNGINKVLTYTVSNRSMTTAAFGIRAQLLKTSGEQILPAMLSDGYFSLMQGETKTISVEVAPATLGNNYRLDLQAYNK